MHVRMHKKYFVRLRWESKDIHIHIYIYIYCSPEMISRYEIRRCQFEQRTILSLFDSLSIGKFIGCVDRRSRELFVSHYRRRRRLFSSLIIIMIRVVHCHHGSHIRNTQWSLVALVDRVIIVRLTIIDGLSIVAYRVPNRVWEDRVDDFVFFNVSRVSCKHPGWNDPGSFFKFEKGKIQKKKSIVK